MEYLLFYISGSMAVAAISFTLAITSIIAPLREWVSKFHSKLEELIHCPWCLSFWMLLVLINTWNIPVINMYEIYILDMFITVFAMYSIIGLIHYVLLRAYTPVMEIMHNRMKEKLQKLRKGAEY